MFRLLRDLFTAFTFLGKIFNNHLQLDTSLRLFRYRLITGLIAASLTLKWRISPLRALTWRELLILKVRFIQIRLEFVLSFVKPLKIFLADWGTFTWTFFIYSLRACYFRMHQISIWLLGIAMIIINARYTFLVLRIVWAALNDSFFHLLDILHFRLFCLLYLLFLGLWIASVKECCNIHQRLVVFPAESFFVPGFDLLTLSGKLLLKSGVLLSELCSFSLLFLSFLGRHVLALSRLEGKPSSTLLIFLLNRRS